MSSPRPSNHVLVGGSQSISKGGLLTTESYQVSIQTRIFMLLFINQNEREPLVLLQVLLGMRGLSFFHCCRVIPGESPNAYALEVVEVLHTDPEVTGRTTAELHIEAAPDILQPMSTSESWR